MRFVSSSVDNYRAARLLECFAAAHLVRNLLVTQRQICQPSDPGSTDPLDVLVEKMDHTVVQVLQPLVFRAFRSVLFWVLNKHLDFLSIDQLLEFKLALEASLFLITEEQQRRLQLTHRSQGTQTIEECVVNIQPVPWAPDLSNEYFEEDEDDEDDEENDIEETNCQIQPNQPSKLVDSIFSTSFKRSSAQTLGPVKEVRFAPVLPQEEQDDEPKSCSPML